MIGDCDLRPISVDPPLFRCARCGWQYVKFVHRNCPALEKTEYHTAAEEAIAEREAAKAREDRYHVVRLQWWLGLVEERWHEADDIRSIEEIRALLEVSALTLPGCPDAIQAVVTDLLYRDRWRQEWGNRPADSS